MTAVGFARSEWRRITSDFVPLLDLAPSTPLPSTPESRYQLFRSFSAAGPQHPDTFPWIDQLAFRRPVLNDVLGTCMGLCRKSNPENQTVIIYGQSGAGKTVLAFQLALELRRRGLPVLLYSQSLTPLGREKVELFCETVSAFSSAPVFLIYDGTRPDVEYVDLTAYFIGRGRKCVVIGTCYPDQRLAPARAHATDTRRLRQERVLSLQVPVSLGADERGHLLQHIDRFVAGAQTHFASLLASTDVANFFAVIYRLLPETHPALEAGIVAEITHGTQRIRDRLATAEATPLKGMTEMEFKLRELLGHSLDNLVSRTRALDASGPREYSGETALSLIHVVMLATAASLPLPQGLALRFVGHDISVYRATSDASILTEIRIGTDDWGLSARHPLEAEIWLAHRLPVPKDRLRLLRALLLCLSRHEVVETANTSVGLEFAVRLLQAYGPDGRRRLPQHYFELADIVTALREKYSTLHPRFLLLQSHLIREAVMGAVRRVSNTAGQPASLVAQRDTQDVPVGEWLAHLTDAEQGLNVAIDVVKANASDIRLSVGAQRMLATLATERACVFGGRLGIRRCLPANQLRLEGAQREANRTFAEAGHSWREAMAYDDTNRYAVDAACWICAERFQMGFRSGDVESPAGVLAEWMEAMDRYMEMQLAPTQMDKRDEREATLSRALADRPRFEAVLERMSRRGTNAVHSLLARDIASREGDASSLEYLDKTCPDVILTDRHLIVLYMRLWWRVHTRFDGYFPHERMCIPFGQQQWRRLHDLTLARLGCSGEETHPTTRFFQACALVHLGDASAAGRLLEALERSNAGGLRRSRSLVLAADENGRPKTYSAEYQGRRRGFRFLAWCDELGTNLFFFPRDFRIPDPRPGMSLGEFHLSIQFRGLLAEPIHRFRAALHGAP